MHNNCPSSEPCLVHQDADGRSFAILGAAAASAQLAGQILTLTFNIIDIYGKITEQPIFVRQQTIYIGQVRNMASLVAQNPSLQTVAIHSILQTCFGTLNQLYHRLQSTIVTIDDGSIVRLQKSLLGVVKENEIERLFSDLAREMALLTLAIQDVTS